MLIKYFWGAVEVQLGETGLCVVTDPMKSVTKLGRASNAAAPMLPSPVATEELGSGAHVEGVKRKYREALEEQAIQLQGLQQTQADILRELQGLVRLAHQRGLGGSLPPSASLRQPSASDLENALGQ